MQEKPQRMCIVCRSMKSKLELIRVVKNKDGEIFIDDTFKAAGRGAYLCKDKNCINKCIKTKTLNKAFKQQINDETYSKLMEVVSDK